MNGLVALYHTPTGFDDIILRSDGEVLTGLCFAHSQEIRDLPTAKSNPQAVFQDVCRWLDIYFSGKQPDFTPAYRTDNLTAFRQQVQQIMCAIPFGHTTTYGEIAKQIADQRGLANMSAQAVGGAVGWNPICIIVPCHRVLGANGRLTGYSGGITNKISLLRLEGCKI